MNNAVDPYQLVPEAPAVETYRRLREEAGLSAKTEAAARIGLMGTYFGVSVLYGTETVGMGRIIGDGGCFFQIVDIAVVPAHQRNGIGKCIMSALIEHLHQQAPESAYVSLLADGEAAKLYAQFGFQMSAPQSVGMYLKL